MKTIRKFWPLVLALALVLFLPTGCTGLASTVRELKEDPAIISAQITTIYGNLKFTRVGSRGTNETVSVATDGTISIKTP